PPRAGAKWEDKRCHRSAKSGPAQAALALEGADTLTSSVTFLSFACSGARLDTGLIQPYAGSEDPNAPVPRGIPLLPSEIEQVRAAVNGRRIDALIVGGGLNDVG